MDSTTSESINHEEKASPPTSTEEVVEAMKRLKILSGHLRIGKARIKPFDRVAARGGKADVELAILAPAEQTSSPASDDIQYVAVKKVRLDAETDDDQALAPFAHEINLLKDFDHSHLVKIIGFVEDIGQGIAWMVFRWEKNGNLREFVQSAKWELPERVSLINDVANGLCYLHCIHPPICHGDLKSLNILVNSEHRAFITDFGSARALDSATAVAPKAVYTTTATEKQHYNAARIPAVERLKAEIAASGEFITITGPAWTVRWAAPELLRGELPGLASDIWAFGWICWEAITGNFPFDEENEVAIISRVVTMNLPKISNNGQLKQLKELCSLMEECLLLDTGRRPSALSCRGVFSWMDQTVPSGSGGNSLATSRSSELSYALGRIQFQNCVMDEAQKYFQQSLDISKSVGDEGGEASALHALGEVFCMRNEESRAEEFFIQSRDIYSRILDQHGFARSVKSLGDVHRMQKDYSKAEESYFQARDIYSRIEDQLGLAQSIH
ncbi:hypothetical protein M407DRAFT_22700, partial [Tulasnella calospora MUT 4182]